MPEKPFSPALLLKGKIMREIDEETKMNKPVVIFGASALARLAHFYFTHDSSYDVAAFTVHREYIDKEELFGLKIIPFESIEKDYPPERYAMFVAISFWGVNRARAQIYRSCKEKGYELVTYISSKAHYWNDMEIGENCMVLEGSVIDPFVKIGNNVIINPGVLVSHDTTVGDHCFIGSNAVINGKVTIGEYSLIGANSTLIEGIDVGSASVVGAGAVITRNVEAGSVYLADSANRADMSSNEVAECQYSELSRMFLRHDAEGSESTAHLKTEISDVSLSTENEFFSLTPIQQAYWVGRGEEMVLGGVSIHFYYEIEAQDFDIQKAERAWWRLIERHPMLRAVIFPSGQQKILRNVPPYKIKVIDLRGVGHEEQKKRLTKLRSEMSHQVMPGDRWPLFDIRIVLLNGKRQYLAMSFDGLMIDERSRNLLFTEWERLYRDPDVTLPPPRSSFERFVKRLHTYRRSADFEADRAYWMRKLPTLPSAPKLPYRGVPEKAGQHRFVRYEDHLRPSEWKKLKQIARQKNLRPSIVVLAAFAETLRVWSNQTEMTVNLPVIDRIARSSEFENVVGEFSSSVLLSIHRDGASNFEEFAVRLQKELEKDLAHSGFSGVEVIRELIKRRGKHFDTLMPVVFTSHLSADSRRGGKNPMAWLGEIRFALTQTPQVYLDYQCHEIDGSFSGVWDVVEEMFPHCLIDDMFTSHFRLLRHLADNSDAWKMSAKESSRLLIPSSHEDLYREMNATDAPMKPKRLHDAFIDRAREQPEQIAVVYENIRMTYAQLEHHSAAVADWLQKKGVRPNELVAVVMGKGWEQIAATLGVLRSGAAYVPIDPALPSKRLDALLEESEVRFVLTQACWNETLQWPEGIESRIIGGDVCGMSEVETIGPYSVEKVDCPAKHDDLAYVIYTSGSTGVPKGVMISHQSAVNTLEDIIDRFGIGSNDRSLALSSLSFDLSVFDIFGTLSAGGTVVLPNIEKRKDPAHWFHLIQEHRITIWNSTPGLMQLLCEYSEESACGPLDSLRLVLLSGDWIPKELPDRIRKEAPNANIVSLGGATEAAIWSILYEIKEIDPAWKSVPYGKPMRNQRFYVLDSFLELCPLMVPGELFIGGEGLALGYWRDEKRTRESFIIHPDTGERLYRTGDIGRLHEDGNIEFLGRKDFQVKIRGFRVELGEVESILTRHPKVRKAVVSVQVTENTTKRLIAYVLPSVGMHIDQSDLHSFAARELPEYMRPSSYIIVEKMPLTPNGKIDREALSVLSENMAFTRKNRIKDPNKTVMLLMEIVSDLLHLSTVAPGDRMIDLGATSIDVIRLINRIEQEFGVRPGVDEIYESENFYRLSALIEAKMEREPSCLSVPNRDIAMQTGQDKPQKMWLKDPIARERFRESLPGIRRDLTGNPSTSLPYMEPVTDIRQALHGRRSYRRFLQGEIAIENIGQLFSSLRGNDADGKLRYFYGSAGKLYPVQTYLYAKTDSIDTIGQGIYYYHPLDHALITINENAQIPETVYDPLINRPIFESAAFGIFLIADLSAIVPMYGEKSMHYATIEAGLMSQILEMMAPSCGLGLCQIGEVEFDKIRTYFGLTDDHVLIHSLLGGKI